MQNFKVFQIIIKNILVKVREQLQQKIRRSLMTSSSVVETIKYCYLLLSNTRKREEFSLWRDQHIQHNILQPCF